jgi:hypothetical protein
MSSKLVQVFEGIMDGAAREYLQQNRTLEGIEAYAYSGLDIVLTDFEVSKIKTAIDMLVGEQNNYDESIESLLSDDEKICMGF